MRQGSSGRIQRILRDLCILLFPGSHSQLRGREEGMTHALKFHKIVAFRIPELQGNQFPAQRKSSGMGNTDTGTWS